MFYKIEFRNINTIDLYENGCLVYQPSSETFDIPFQYNQIVWFAYKKHKRWVLRKSKIDSVWATNMIGIKLDNGKTIPEYMFNQLFDNEDKAVAFCIENNLKSKVKIYNKHCY